MSAPSDGRGAGAGNADPVTTPEPATAKQPDSSSIVTAALDYRARGWRPIQLHGLRKGSTTACTCRRGATCGRSTAKHPVDDDWQAGDGETIADDYRRRPYAHNVGLRTGKASGLFVLDVDPDNGGQDNLDVLLAEHGSLPPTLTVRTGSGGTHYYFAYPEGVDLGNSAGRLGKGLDTRGEGGQVVAPPSVSGKGAYSVLDDVPIAEAPSWLLERLTTRGAPVSAATFPEPLPDAYLRKAVGDELRRLDAMREAATADGLGYDGEPWDVTTFAVACNLVELSNGSDDAYPLDRAYADLFDHAPTDAGFPSSRVAEKWASAQKTVGDKARARRAAPVADGGGTTKPVEGGGGTTGQPGGGEEDKFSAAAVVIEHVTRRYDLGVTSNGEPFAVPRRGPRLPVMLGVSGGTLRSKVTADLYDGRRVLRAQAVDDGFRVIIARASSAIEATTLHLRVADLGERIVLDLGQPGSARCVVIDRTGWTVRENPPEGVLFRRTPATRPLPEPVRGGSLDLLRGLLGFSADDQRWALVRGWLVASLFAERTRPMLTFVGPPGSAKTTRARLVVSVLDPRAELGSNFGKAIADDQTKALSRFLVSYDNLASVSEAVSDHLCRLVTGDEIDRRRLYTDADLSTITYRRTGVMTAVTLPGLRADALERVVLLPLDRIPEAGRRSEAALRGAFDEAHPRILGAVFDALVGTLNRLPAAAAAVVKRPRMSDYYDVLAAYDEEAAQAYRDAAADVMADAAEADPFVAAVRAWLASVNGSWKGTPSEVYAEATAHRRRQPSTAFDSQSQWWPRTSAAFVGALDKATEPLRAVGIYVKRGKSNGLRFLSLTTVLQP